MACAARHLLPGASAGRGENGVSGAATFVAAIVSNTPRPVGCARCVGGVCWQRQVRTLSFCYTVVQASLRVSSVGPRDLRFTSAMVARETAVAVYVVPTPTVRVLLPLYHTNCELTPQVHVLLAGYRAAASINSGLSRTNKSLATVRTDNAACRNDLATTHRAITTFIAACVVRSTGHGQLPPSDADDTNIDQASRGARGASLQRPVAPVADADIPCR